MRKVLYSARAEVTGGRENGRGRSGDGRLDLRLRPPTELGGDGDGTNPEQLLAIGWGACFGSTLSLVAQRHGLRYEDVADAVIETEVMLGPGEDWLEIGAAIDVALPSVADEALAADLVRAAHERCPYSAATRGNIEVELRLNGRALEAVAA